MATHSATLRQEDGPKKMAFANGGELVIDEGTNAPTDYVTQHPAGSVAVAGAVLAIPITNAIAVKTTGGAEALTLANGKPGQILVLTLAVDGGTGTLTPATKTGFTTIAFADAGDTVSLMYVDDTVGWVILGTAGVAAPPAIAIT